MAMIHCVFDVNQIVYTITRGVIRVHVVESIKVLKRNNDTETACIEEIHYDVGHYESCTTPTRSFLSVVEDDLYHSKEDVATVWMESQGLNMGFV